MEQRFDAAEWTDLATGSPILTNALVSFDCKVTQITRVGTTILCFVKLLHSVATMTATDWRISTDAIIR